MSVEAAIFVGVERQHPNSARQHRRTRPHRSTASPRPVDIAAVISVGRVGEEAEDRARSRTSSRVDLLSYGLVNLVTGYEALDGIRLRAHIRCLYRDEHLHARTSGMDETRVHLDRLARSDRRGEVNVADGGRDAAGA